MKIYVTKIPFAITHVIFSASDGYQSSEIRGIFLCLSKAFDRVWLKGLLHKLKHNGIDSNVLSLIVVSKSFLLNGQSSKCRSTTRIGFRTTFSFIYVNDIPRGLHSDVELFADETSLFSIIDNVNASASKLNNDLIKIQHSAYKWKMSFNQGVLPLHRARA